MAVNPNFMRFHECDESRDIRVAYNIASTGEPGPVDDTLNSVEWDTSAGSVMLDLTEMFGVGSSQPTGGSADPAARTITFAEPQHSMSKFGASGAEAAGTAAKGPNKSLKGPNHRQGNASRGAADGPANGSGKQGMMRFLPQSPAPAAAPQSAGALFAKIGSGDDQDVPPLSAEVRVSPSTLFHSAGLTASLQ